MITTVILDLDDTLYDEVDYCRSGFRAVARFLDNLSHTPSPEHTFDCLWKHFTAGNHTTTFNAALDELGIAYDNKFIQNLVKVYRNHLPKITLPPESRDVLSALCGKYTLAMLTDGFLPAQKLKVQALGIEKFFKSIVYTEQLGRQFWKPSPAGFEKLMQTLNAKPENIVYVADNEEKDFIAPNKLGILTIQLIRPARLHSDSSQQSAAAPRYVIHKISQLPALLHKL
jgi:putative hydrolase of the HAD superfamily